MTVSVCYINLKTEEYMTMSIFILQNLSKYVPMSMFILQNLLNT